MASEPSISTTDHGLSLLNTLRTATRELHGQLDSMTSPDEVTRSREACAAYLARFREGLAECLPMLDWRLFAELALPSADQRRKRYEALDDDLLASGLVCPVCLPPRGTSAAAVGCLYVLEGSIHGGGILLARLVENTGPVAEGEHRFLRGFGERNVPMWREFVAWLASLDADAAFREEAAAGAREAFGHFLSAFAPCQREASPSLS